MVEAVVLLGWWIWSRPEQVKTKRQACGASAVGQEAKVSDTHKPCGSRCKQEAAQELIDR